MKFLGIDPGSSNYAYVILNEDNVIIHQENFKFKGADFDAGKLYEIWKRVSEIDFSEVDFACVEGYAIGKRFYAEQLGEIGAINRLSLFGTSTNFSILPPTSLKYYFTGSGKADKHQIRNELLSVVPNVAKDTNISDATALALFAKDLYFLITEGRYPTEPFKCKILKELLFPKDEFIIKKRRMLYLFNIGERFSWAFRDKEE